MAFLFSALINRVKPSTFDPQPVETDSPKNRKCIEVAIPDNSPLAGWDIIDLAPETSGECRALQKDLESAACAGEILITSCKDCDDSRLNWTTNPYFSDYWQAMRFHNTHKHCKNVKRSVYVPPSPTRN